MTTYMRVAEDEGGECIEIPVEDDGTLFLSTLVAQFPGACGLKYRNPDTKALRGVKLIEERLISPDEGWIFDFFCVFPKVDIKRKSSDELESSTTKSKRTDAYNKCSDLIVLDLPYKTTESELKDHFSSFGNVVMAQIKRDGKTGQSRGYGFIRFDEITAQKEVLSTRHVIGGRNCDVRIPKSQVAQYEQEPSDPYLSSKIFVGRVTEDFTEKDLREYFGKYGEVSYVFLPKNPFRAFSFVQFNEPQAARHACDEDDHIIKKVSVSVSTAKARKDGPKDHMMGGGGGYMGGGGGGGGGYNNMGGYNNGGGYGGGYNNAGGFNSGGYGGGGGYNNGGYNSGYGNRNSGGGGGGGNNRRNGGKNPNWSNSGSGGDWNDPKGVDYSALAAPIVAAISQQLGVAPPNMAQPPPPPPRHYNNQHY